jgi:hypothetical protein
MRAWIFGWPIATVRAADLEEHMRKLASILALGGLTTAIACGDDGISGVSTTGGEDDSTSSTGGPPGLTTAITTLDDTADSTGGSTGEATSETAGDTTGEPPGDSSGSTSDGAGACGNGMVDAGETCDGVELDGETCEGLGLGAGTLACADDCSDFDTRGCANAPRCGDGVLDDGEACDDDQLGDQTCESLDFDAGTLACTTDCELDTTGCVLFSCGNGVIEDKEACDGTELDGATCAGLGFGAGEVVCSAQCQLDTSACCGDGQQGGTEACDDLDLDGQTCAGLGYPGGTLACTADCTLDETACSVCGDATIGDGEVCDGADLGGADCASIGMGFFGGTLACAPVTCQYDTSACNLCGNAAIDAGEACDGADLGGATCAGLGLGFTGGTLSCAAGCDLDTSACTSFPVPGTGDVVVSEIMYDPNVLPDGSGGEWFELHNPSATDTMQLQGCTLESNNASETFAIDVPLTIAPGDFIVLAGSPDPLAIGFAADYVLPSTFSLANAGDFVRLSCNGTIVDEVAYDDVAPWPDAAPGQSLNLDPDSLDASLNDAAGAWCVGTNDFFMGELGTPGTANTDCADVSTWTIGFCRLQFPTSIDETAGTAVTVYGRVYAQNLTDQSPLNDPDPQLVGQLGYGPDGSDPAVDATWTWTDATPNPGWDGSAVGEVDNDEYQASLVVPPPPPTDRDYAYRFSGDGGATFTYCDGDNGGSTTGYAPADAGQLVSSPAPIPELWFSEYVEGSSFNKAIEIYNGGTDDAVLDACTLTMYFNGSVTPDDNALSGTLAPGDTFVVCDSSIVDTTFCDAFTTPTWNGDDAIAIICSGTTLDVFGQIGVDPGSAWTMGGVTTANATLRRQCTVAAGDPDGSNAFDPSLEWVAAPVDDFTDLGGYICP